MENVYRLRPVNWIRELGLPIISLTLLVALAWVTAGESAIQKSIITLFLLGAGFHLVIILFAQKHIGMGSAVGIWGILVFVNAPFSLGEYLKTRNEGFLFAFLFQLSASMFAAFVVITQFDMNPWLILLFVLSMLVFGVLGIYYNFSRRSKWRYREILELAATEVNELSNGYTSRPKPVTVIPANKGDIQRFGRFLLKNLIAIPYYEDERVVFSLAMTLRHRIGLSNEYGPFSYVCFYYDGRITVHISKSDYQKYKEQLAFDQLCESMGKLFEEFYELYISEQEIRIMDRLNRLKLSPFEDFGESAI